MKYRTSLFAFLFVAITVSSSITKTMEMEIDTYTDIHTKLQPLQTSPEEVSELTQTIMFLTKAESPAEAIGLYTAITNSSCWPIIKQTCDEILVGENISSLDRYIALFVSQAILTRKNDGEVIENEAQEEKKIRTKLKTFLSSIQK